MPIILVLQKQLRSLTWKSSLKFLCKLEYELLDGASAPELTAEHAVRREMCVCVWSLAAVSQPFSLSVRLQLLNLAFGVFIHTHTRPFNGTTWVSRYQKGRTNLDFTEARDSEWQWHQLGHMQVYTSLQTDNHDSTSPLSFYRLDALPTAHPTASKHWRHKWQQQMIWTANKRGWLPLISQKPVMEIGEHSLVFMKTFLMLLEPGYWTTPWFTMKTGVTVSGCSRCSDCQKSCTVVCALINFVLKLLT